ncbi:MAG TPA: AI-2E family transporter [Spirochaetota bacterium]|nr:AI-2E family transporter [Spirochaetota bacterium]HOL56115.1 AI-2E family transporter [Spirochaetota bacterium]HPP04062.1 AI-2E family transporter [Spirochaetota bacterium]
MSTYESNLKKIILILSVFLVALILYLTHKMSGFLIPIFLAFFTALLFQPLLKKLEKTKIPSWISTILVILLSISLLTAFLFILISSLQNFLDDFPVLTNTIQTKIIEIISNISELEFIKIFGGEQKLKNLIFEFFAKINFGAYMISTINKTLGILKNFFLYIFALIFIMPGINKISYRISKAFPENSLKINKIIINITEQIQRYIVVKSIISFITGVLTFLVCFIFGVKYSLLWGLFAFLLNYIPYIGSIIAVFLPVLLAFVQFPTIVKPLLILTFLIVIQNILGNLLEPKFQSQGSNLSSIVIFTSLLVWGYIWGIAGIFLAVPIMSAFNVVCQNIEILKPVTYLISARHKKKKKNLNFKKI